MADEVMTALPNDHRFMVAWKAFQGTDEFKNALMWATALYYPDNPERGISEINREQYAKGSMWLAFTKGMEVSEVAAEVPSLPDARERRIALLAGMAATIFAAIPATAKAPNEGWYFHAVYDAEQLLSEVECHVDEGGEA